MRGPLTVKICGVRDGAGLAACVAAGVDFVGFNFIETSRRKIPAAVARDLRPHLGAVAPIALLCDAELAEITAVTEACEIRWVQLHGAEPPALCAALSARGLRVIKALSAASLHRAGDYAAHVSAFLADGPRPGSGTGWDPAGLRGPSLAGRPLWLAGGLNPENVAARVAQVAPAGVDTASGVERDGRLAADRVAAFTAAARAARAQDPSRGAA